MIDRKYHVINAPPKTYSKLSSGDKNCITKRNDRDYATGDVVRIREWIPDSDRYTDKELTADLIAVHKLTDGRNVSLEISVKSRYSPRKRKAKS